MYCKSCGKQIASDDLFCTSCGNPTSHIKKGNIKSKKNSKRKKMFFISGIALALVIIVAIITIPLLSTPNHTPIPPFVQAQPTVSPTPIQTLPPAIDPTPIQTLPPIDPTPTQTLFISEGEYTASFIAQMEPISGWELGEIATALCSLGRSAVIKIDFGQTVSFGDGNFIAINTNLPNNYDGAPFSDPNIAEVISFKLDGKRINVDNIYINAEGMNAFDGNGYGLRLTLANKWSSISKQPVDPLELGEFDTLEIEFIIHKIAPPPPTLPPQDPATQGYAYIGGTFAFLNRNHPSDADDDVKRCDWWAFEDQKVNFEFGEQFTVSIDMGREKIRHDRAYWNGEDYIIAIDTDVESNPGLFNAYIHSITKDGVNVPFNPNNVTVGRERGNLRISITNSWAEFAGDPVPIAGPFSIGEFSKLEITLTIYN